AELSRVAPRLFPIESDQLEQFHRPPAGAPLVPAEQSRHRRHVVEDGPVREQPRVLDDVADAAAELVLGDGAHVAPADGYDAGGGVASVSVRLGRGPGDTL